MITKIVGEQPFQVLTNNFSISPSSEGYTLQISADGVNYSNLFTVGAGVTRLVTGVAANSYYKLSGNQSQVSINWMKMCVTEGQGGGNAGELEPVTAFPVGAPEGTVVALASGDTVGVYQYDGENWNPVGNGGGGSVVELTQQEYLPGLPNSPLLPLPLWLQRLISRMLRQGEAIHFIGLVGMPRV